jgi:hypothetical protein
MVVAVAGVGVFEPTPRTGSDDADPVAPDLALLPRTLRRGLSAGMKYAVAAAGPAVAQARRTGALAADAELPIVYGSAVGETATAIDLLTTIVAAHESSPVSFRHSVHNAAPGLLSIALGTLASSTAVAAGAETLLATLLEAAALLNEGAPAVLVILAEEGASPLLAPDEIAGAGAVACVLTAPGAGRPDATALAFLTMPALTEDAGRAAGDRDSLRPALELARAIAAAPDAVTRVALSAASPAGRSWQARVAATREVST